MQRFIQIGTTAARSATTTRTMATVAFGRLSVWNLESKSSWKKTMKEENKMAETMAPQRVKRIMQYTPEQFCKVNAVKNWNRRAAPENKPLTMEELRRMDGEPVFAIPLNKNADWIEHWAILRKGIVTANSISTKGRMYFLYLKDYGKTWLAYAHKPERSE